LATLLLVRHGETEWNQTGRYQGQTDIGLSEAGVQQAERLRRSLSSNRIDGVYASDLKRTMETAAIIAAPHQLKIQPCTELRELNFGEMEGKSFEEIQRDYSALIQAWRTGNIEAIAPQGESPSQLAARVARFMPQLKKEPADKTLFIVAHGGSLQMLVCLLLGINPANWLRFRLDTASLTIARTYSEQAVLTLLNDTCHLRGGLNSP